MQLIPIRTWRADEDAGLQSSTAYSARDIVTVITRRDISMTAPAVYTNGQAIANIATAARRGGRYRDVPATPASGPLLPG
ncbi:MAG: hypothetical protein J4F47_05215 [Alphaproteobacteria bacterium]|nr:hypothetical protein [Alphaproteobacteria bacterium]